LVMPLARSLTVDCLHLQIAAMSSCRKLRALRSAMINCQSIPLTLSGVRYRVKRAADIGHRYSADMTNKARTEYGARLYTARKHAKLTQTAIAKAVGMSQSAYAEAESTGLSSTFTAQLAAACGVNPNWLATGEGSMLANTEHARPEADQLADALAVLTRALQKADEDARISLEPLLASMAREPEKAGTKARLIVKLLVTSYDNVPAAENDRPGHIRGDLGILNLGDGEHGRRDRAAAKGSSKR
jgi:transcriptional regulator with XRE-family HTH domain